MISGWFVKIQGFFEKRTRNWSPGRLVPWAAAGLVVAWLSQSASMAHFEPDGIGGLIETPVESFSLPDAEATTRYYVLAVEPDGSASLISLDDLIGIVQTPVATAEVSPTAAASPTASPSPAPPTPTRVPNATATPFEVTPIAPTPGYPRYTQVEREYVPLTKLRIRRDPFVANNWTGLYAFAGTSYPIYHFREYGDGSVWGCMDDVHPANCQRWFVIVADLTGPAPDYLGPPDGKLEEYAEEAPELDG